MEPPAGPLDKNVLVDLAGVAFRGATQSDIPEKVWTTWALDTLYVRATWGSGITARRTTNLEILAAMIQETYRVPTVAVAYSEDMDWATVDALAEALATVR